MSNVIALIPARAGSKGIPGKNWRELGGKTLIEHALDCALDARIDAYVSTDAIDRVAHVTWFGMDQIDREPTVTRGRIERPAALAQDDTPMYDVVRHAVETLQLAEDDIVVIVQPTQPFRKPEHLTTAVQMLGECPGGTFDGWDSVVSVVPVPPTYAPELQLDITHGALCPLLRKADGLIGSTWMWTHVPTRRQDVPTRYRRDGTVYAAWVQTIRQYGNLYGGMVRPLILDPSESCELDTEADWEAVTARWSALHEAKHER